MALTGHVQVAAAVFALRGTRLTKAGTVQADIQLMKDRDAELYYSQRALKHVHKHIRRLTLQQPDVQWGFFTTGPLPLSSLPCLFQVQYACFIVQKSALQTR